MKFLNREMPGSYHLEVRMLFMAWWLTAIDTLVVRWAWTPKAQRYHQGSREKAEGQYPNMHSRLGRFVAKIDDALRGDFAWIERTETSLRDLELLYRKLSRNHACWATGGVKKMSDVTKEMSFITEDVQENTRQLCGVIVLLEQGKEDQ
jgi:hypothetical protein